MPRAILITRPEAAARRFAARIHARLGDDVPVMISPLMQIEHVPALPPLTDIRSLLFTSRTGVEAFAAQSRRRDFICYCVGEATAAAASDAGLTAIPCTGNVEDLISRVVAEAEPGPCLHIRGQYATGDLSQRLSAAGIPTRQAILYRQARLPLTTHARSLLQGEDPVFLPLFSPRTARLLMSDVQFSAPLTVVALSPNVAAELSGFDVGRLFVAERPDAEAMLDKIAVAWATAKPLEGGNLAQ